MADKCDRCGGIWHGGSPCTSFTSKSVNLVERLRFVAKWPECERDLSGLLEDTAADEIERLVAALTEILEFDPHPTAKDVARRALGFETAP